MIENASRVARCHKFWVLVWINYSISIDFVNNLASCLGLWSIMWLSVQVEVIQLCAWCCAIKFRSFERVSFGIETESDNRWIYLRDFLVPFSHNQRSFFSRAFKRNSIFGRGAFHSWEKLLMKINKISIDCLTIGHDPFREFIAVIKYVKYNPIRF